jgi:hypothetical protein
MANVIDFSGRSVPPPQQGDGYRCFRLTDDGKPEERLFLVFRDPSQYLILAYDDMESIGPARGRDPNDVAVLRFRGTVNREVRIEGWALMYVVDHLWRRRAVFLSETPAGWRRRGGNSPFITRISVREFR